MSHGANKLHMPYLTIWIYCSWPISGKSINCFENPMNSWRLKLMSNCVFWIKLVIPYKYVYFTFIRRGGHRRTNSFHTTKNCIGSFWSKELHLGSDLQKNCIRSLIYCSGPGHRIGTLLYPCVGQNAPKSMRIKGTCQGVICTCQNFLVH